MGKGRKGKKTKDKKTKESFSVFRPPFLRLPFSVLRPPFLRSPYSIFNLNPDLVFNCKGNVSPNICFLGGTKDVNVINRKDVNKRQSQIRRKE
jgi:hypothetical protein